MRLVSWLQRIEPLLEPLEEAAYRQHHLAADIRQVRIFIVIVILASLSFLPVDLFLLQQHPTQLLLVLLLRGCTILGSWIFWQKTKQIHTSSSYDHWVFGYTIAVSIVQGISATTRPANYYGTSIFDIVLILYYYLVIPNTLTYRSISAVLMSLFSLLVLFLLREASLLYAISIPIIMMGVHFMGLINSTQVYRYRRAEYHARHQIAELNKQLTILAETDSLTGVYNRRKLIALGHDEFARFQRYGNRFSLILIDIDFFKRINDQYGHPVGDTALIMLTTVIQQGKRTNDAIGRLGGEEFALLLPETPHDAAIAVAERLRYMVAATPLDTPDGPLILTFSAGVAEIDPADSSFEHLLQRADQLLYHAKQQGRNRIEAGAKDTAKDTHR
ncbi:MAG: hypothetical protein Fur005_08610 [Roseiflexaceae bacterium]